MKLKNIILLNLTAPYPPYDGGSIRTFELLKALAHEYRVTFIATYDPTKINYSDLHAHLIQFCARVELVPEYSQSRKSSRRVVLQDMFTYPPPRIAKRMSTEYRGCVERVVAEVKPELILCNTILAGQVFARSNVGKHIPRILDTFDVFASLRRREMLQEKSRRLIWLWKCLDYWKSALYEQTIWRKFNALIAISEIDAEMIRATVPEKNVRLVPMGISLPQLPVVDTILKDFDVLFVGKLDYPPNVAAISWFDQNVMPLLFLKKPQIKVAIVGKSPNQAIQSIVKGRDNYCLFADVPELASYYARSKTVIIPIRAGSGVKVKLIEALAYRMPIVTTSIGADGIPVRHMEHAIIADDADDFATGILGLISNKDLSSALAEQGFLLAQSYDKVAVQREYMNIVAEFMNC